MLTSTLQIEVGQRSSTREREKKKKLQAFYFSRSQNLTYEKLYNPTLS